MDHGWPSPNRSIVNTKWLFSWKYESNGSWFITKPCLLFKTSFNKVLTMLKHFYQWWKWLPNELCLHLQICITITSIIWMSLLLFGVTFYKRRFTFWTQRFCCIWKWDKSAMFNKIPFWVKNKHHLFGTIFLITILKQGFLKCLFDTNVHLKRSTKAFIILGLFDDLILVFNYLLYLLDDNFFLFNKKLMIDNQTLNISL